ncbi:hypothetical protein FRC12_007473 [Ceratobasidium sp. 428]|nr:hypothetical protein FRC12_007473 [Ceratobasidium sp. 428]
MSPKNHSCCVDSTISKNWKTNGLAKSAGKSLSNTLFSRERAESQGVSSVGKEEEADSRVKIDVEPSPTPFCHSTGHPNEKSIDVDEFIVDQDNTASKRLRDATVDNTLPYSLLISGVQAEKSEVLTKDTQRIQHKRIRSGPEAGTQAKKSRFVASSETSGVVNQAWPDSMALAGSRNNPPHQGETFKQYLEGLAVELQGLANLLTEDHHHHEHQAQNKPLLLLVKSNIE